MLGLIVFGLCVSQFLLFPAEGLSWRFQAACLQIAKENCSSSEYWQSVCSEVAKSPASGINLSTQANTTEPRINSPRRVNISDSRKNSSRRVNISDSRINSPRRVNISDSRINSSRRVNISDSRKNSSRSVNISDSRVNLPRRVNISDSRINEGRRVKITHSRIKLSSKASTTEPRIKSSGDNGNEVEKSTNFKFIQKKATWDEARRICSVGRGWLAQVDHSYKWQYLKEHKSMLNAKGFFDYIWIGLRFDPRRKRFFWIDGAQFQKHHGKWSPGEPSHYFRGKEENCVAFTKYTGMNDRNCNKRSSFLCEHKSPSN